MDAASMEQMNKLRKTLGLPLLNAPSAQPTSVGPTFRDHSSDASDDEEPASTLETREAAGYDNYQQLQEAERAKKHREAKITALKKARDASQKVAKLEGRGLGELGGERDVDARAWLKSQSKRMKKIEAERAERTARELEDRERLAAIKYNTSDLAGVHVAHEIDDFDEAEGEQILTLKDKVINDEDDEDELEARELVESETLAKKLDSKKKKSAYDVHADGDGSDRKILSQYDEDNEKKRKFTLDSTGQLLEAREAKKRAVGDLLQSSKSMISLKVSAAIDQPMSDYLTDIKIKKPKKDKKKKREKVADDEDSFPVNGSHMEVDQETNQSNPVQRRFDNVIQDDDDLQLALARSRRAAFKKQKRMRPEDIAKSLRTESATPEREQEDEQGMVFDETTAFVEGLQVHRPETKLPAVPKRVAEPEEPQQTQSPRSADDDIDMDASYNAIEDEEDPEQRGRREASSGGPVMPTTGLENEETVEQGLGSTLKLLKDRGIVKNAEGGINISEVERQRQFFLEEKRRREADSEVKARVQREKDRTGGTFERMSVKDRQDYARFENSRREQQDQRAMADFFNNNYKPNVNIKYVDDTGRQLDQKEAFKHLSHQFHGKGSGRQKTEKRLKKIDDERKREAMSALDSSQRTGGMERAQDYGGRKAKQAGVRLA